MSQAPGIKLITCAGAPGKHPDADCGGDANGRAHGDEGDQPNRVQGHVPLLLMYGIQFLRLRVTMLRTASYKVICQ